MLLLLFIRHDPGLVELEHVPVNVITGFHCLVPHHVFILAALFPKVNLFISNKPVPAKECNSLGQVQQMRMHTEYHEK